ncbi:MAG: efflux RND transporter periplasmic adaptor subunit [Acidobacteria bacterium]|nr:efflux RND transporter periplasmic adaptor subunit [Acidobacteriota bacterium]
MSMDNKRYSRFKFPAAFLAAALLLAAAALCLQPASAQNPGLGGAKSKTPLPKPTVKMDSNKQAVYTVANEQIIKELVLTGELKAARSVIIFAPNIRSSFSNTVSFLAPEGAIVKKGERIVEFDDSSLLSNKSEAERTLDEAKLNIEKKKADLEAERCDLLNSLAQAESTLKQDELYGRISKDLLAGNTYQKYQLNVTKSKLSLQKARENLENFEKSYASQMSLVEIKRSQAEIDLKKIESDMQLLKIDAPQDGILIYGDNWTSNRKIQPGDSLFQGMEVASLPDLSSLQVIGSVYDTEYSSLQSDMRCIVTLDSLPGFEVGGRIFSRTSVASRKSFVSEKKVFQVTVQLDKVDPAIMKPGMTARVRVPRVLEKEATAILREYLGVDSLGRYFVLKGTEPKKASVQPVTIGAVGDRLVQAISGVSVGDPLLSPQRLAEVSK